MKTLATLCRRFGKQNPGWEAVPDCLDSFPGCYVLYIGRVGGLNARYIFETIREIRDWMRGVVLD